jgi:hypothetical protein
LPDGVTSVTAHPRPAWRKLSPVAVADDVPCRNTRETSMSKHQDKLQQKSPAKPEIDNDRGALDDQDLAKVTGGDKASPKEFPKEIITLDYGRIEYQYK